MNTEQRAREILRHAFGMSDTTAAAMRRMDADNMSEVEQAALLAVQRGIEEGRALSSAARQNGDHSSTHHVHQGPESLPCYCAATSDHPINQEKGR